MSPPESEAEEPVRARKVLREDARPQTVFERQETLSAYLLRRARRRRERFLLRARTTTIRGELVRALFLTGCIFLDLLVIPEAILLFPGVLGWSITGVGIGVAVWLEWRFYENRFALRGAPADRT